MSLNLPEEFKIDLSGFGEGYCNEFVEKVLQDNDFVYSSDREKFYDHNKKPPVYITLRKDGLRTGYDMVMYNNIELPIVSASEYMVNVLSESIESKTPKSESTVSLVFVRQYIEAEFGVPERERFDHALKWRK